ncbi:MAG: ribonuclease III [Bacteroidales bacterium]|nr:ribonuclease III [Bacteroidales bacterium]
MESKLLISNLIQSIRLLTVKQKEPYFLFRSILGFYPRRIEIYEQALRHKSLSLRTENGLLLNNERLEFLGDAVLNVLVADILFKQFETKNEDFLSKTRSKIVQRNSLNKIAMELGLDKLIVTSTPIELPHHSIYGNALEALIGAIYIDQGYRQCKRFLEKKILERYVDIERVASIDMNFKSILLEWSQHKKVSLHFDTFENQKQEGRTTKFKASAMLNGVSIGEGEGCSKKEAQQEAAKAALSQMENEPGKLKVLLESPVMANLDSQKKL